jgi:hypothetical protein
VTGKSGLDSGQGKVQWCWQSSGRLSGGTLPSLLSDEYQGQEVALIATVNKPGLEFSNTA